jgi:hypothetical protein
MAYAADPEKKSLALPMSGTFIPVRTHVLSRASSS